MKTKRLCWLMLSFTAGLYTLLVFGMSLLYTYANTDIVLYTSVLPEILDVLMDITEIAVFAIGFGILMYACFHRATIALKLGLVGIFSGAVLLRRICDLAVSLIVFSAIEIEDLVYAIAYLILDLALIWGVAILIHLLSRQYFKRMILKAKASVLFKDTVPLKLKEEDVFPFKKIYSKANPLQRCALFSGIVLSAVKIISRILYDIGYGAPDGLIEILIIIVYYSSDIALGILYYFGVLLVLTRLFHPKKKATKSQE